MKRDRRRCWTTNDVGKVEGGRGEWKGRRVMESVCRGHCGGEWNDFAETWGCPSVVAGLEAGGDAASVVVDAGAVEAFGAAAAAFRTILRGTA